MSILTAPRFSFELPRAKSSEARRVRTAWISDVHLGTRGANAGALLDFLREYDFEKLYIVGDLIDIWQLRRGIYWPQQHNDVIQKILRKSRKGTRTITATSPCRSMPFIVWRTVAACSLFMDMSSTRWCKT